MSAVLGNQMLLANCPVASSISDRIQIQKSHEEKQHRTPRIIVDLFVNGGPIWGICMDMLRLMGLY